MIERKDPVNWSTLRFMRKSPKHYRHALLHSEPDTEAMQLGRLTHAVIYEPAEVHMRYVQEPNFHRGMKDETAIAKGYDGGKEAAAAFATNGREPIKPALWQAAHAMGHAVRHDPIAAPMIQGGFAEQLITWTDRETGIECRGRVDHVNGCLSDLKTSNTLDSRVFAAKAVRLGYHAQLAFYADGLQANGIMLVEPPALIVVESVAPHDVVVMEFSDADLAAGRRTYRACLTMLAECRATDRWPGISGGSRVPMALPEWAAPETDETLTLGGVPIDFWPEPTGNSATENAT